MLRYEMKDKGFSTTYGFVISDHADRPVYRADGKNWTISREYTLKDIEGLELLHLKQKLLSLSRTYTISRGGDHYATIKQSGRNYLIDMPSQSPIEVKKSVTGLEYSFLRDGRQIACANPKPISLTENCTVEIETTEDAELVLASMVAIYDMKRH